MKTLTEQVYKDQLLKWKNTKIQYHKFQVHRYEAGQSIDQGVKNLKEVEQIFRNLGHTVGIPATMMNLQKLKKNDVYTIKLDYYEIRLTPLKGR